MGVQMVEPISLNLVRFIGTGLLFLPFAGRISLSDLIKLIPVSLFFVSGNLICAYIALDYVSSNSFIILVQSAQPFTLVLAWFLFKERFGIYTTAGIIIALSGLIVVFGAPDILSAPFGAFMVLAAAFFWSAGSLAMKRTGHIKPAAFLSYSYLMSIPIALIATYMLEDHQVQSFIDADPLTIGFVLVYQIGLMGIMTFVWSDLMARYPAQYITPFLMLQPIVAIIGSYFMLGEELTREIIMGGIIVLFGIGIINFRRLTLFKKSEKTASAE